MNFYKITVYLLLVKCGRVSVTNILFATNVLAPSHHIWNKALLFDLVERGHNITMLSNDYEESRNNFTFIQMEGVYKAVQNKINFEELAKAGPIDSIKALYTFVEHSCRFGFATKGFQRLLNYPTDFKFDLIIFDASVGQCLLPLIQRFNDPPAVGVTAFLLPPVIGRALGNHIYTSYMPYYTTANTNKMNLVERLLNFIYTYLEMLYARYISSPLEFQLAKNRFGDHIRSFDELERSMTLLLCNIDPVLDYPIALPPNIIPVGGLHLKPAKPLPKHLEKIINNAEHGVIFFAMGTSLRSDKLELATRKAFFDAFAKLKQIVVWKFETANVKGLPKNVVTRKWFPQNDILGHPNTKLFISHGGALSTQEAMYHGVPILGMPVCMDEHSIVSKISERKIGIYLNLNNITKDDVYNSINELLNNPIYSNNIKTLSKRYRDQPQTALERGVFWIEYALIHGGVKHLVPVSRDMPFYQIVNLDILAVIAVGVFALYNLISVLLTLCLYRKAVKTSQKINKLESKMNLL